MNIITTLVVFNKEWFKIKEPGSFSDDEVIKCFNELGLSKYEGKIYLALLRNNLSYGSEIQKFSGVPGPKVYETLNALIDKGLIYPSGDNPVRYQPLPLEDFVQNNITKHLRINSYLIDHKNSISQNKYPSWLWQIQGYDNLMDKARELIGKAEKTIMISFWHNDGVKVQKQMEDAIKRGVKIISNQMSKKIIPLGQVFRHETEILQAVEKVHSSEFILVVDDLFCMFAFKNQDQKIEGYYTSNHGVINIIENYICHDIYINRLISDFKESVLEKYGNNLEGLLNL